MVMWGIVGMWHYILPFALSLSAQLKTGAWGITNPFPISYTEHGIEETGEEKNGARQSVWFPPGIQYWVGRQERGPKPSKCVAPLLASNSPPLTIIPLSAGESH